MPLSDDDVTEESEAEKERDWFHRIDLVIQQVIHQLRSEESGIVEKIIEKSTLADHPADDSTMSQCTTCVFRLLVILTYPPNLTP